MNIRSFETDINRTILERGYEYFYEGNIIEIDSVGDEEYIFTVQGSEDYEVFVKMDENGEILHSGCDCPYDFGPICKHEVAAFYKLSDMKNDKGNDKKSTGKKPKITEVLANLSKEELIRIIEDITEDDSVLKDRLIFKYSRSSDSQELENCRKLMKSIVRKYTRREGFIRYRDAFDYASEMGNILEKASDIENPLAALDISFLVLNEAVEAFQYADDSGGAIGSLVKEAIETIREIATGDLTEEIKEAVFHRLLRESESTIFDGWEDFRIDLLEICLEFTDNQALKDILRIRIEQMINGISDDSYMEFYRESLLRILFNIIEKSGEKEEAEAFIRQNLNFSSFREQLIQKYIEEKDYQKVIELALEGEAQDKQYPGLVLKWKKLRYIALKNLSLIAEQEQLARELLFNGRFEYYNELKELVAGDRKSFYNKLKEDLKKAKEWHLEQVFLKLIEEENDIDELLEYVKRNPSSIEQYSEMLRGRYKDEVIEVYEKYIKAAADSSSNRKEYRGVCGILRRYKKIAGAEHQAQLIRELTDLYKRRPAFLDELSKIKVNH